MREEYIVTRDKESVLLKSIQHKLKETFPDCNAENTLVVMVSPDYSATIAMHVAHELSVNGEMCDILPIHVNYPDEAKDKYVEYAQSDILRCLTRSEKRYTNYLLVEAGVIKGGTFTWLTKLCGNLLSGQVHTMTMFENIHSVFKSDLVLEYYDNETQDLTFYFERENKHWN